MNNTNRELLHLMKEFELSREVVARILDIQLETVYQWTRTEGSKSQRPIPESELSMLKYSLMSENKRSTLF